jgi:hypothetical protein
MVLRSHLQAKALGLQATIVLPVLRQSAFLSKPGTAPLYPHLLVHPPTKAALLHPLHESPSTVISLHYTPKPMPAPYQHTLSTHQSCNPVVCRWVRPRRPKALDHPHHMDFQNTAPMAQEHHTTITHLETVHHRQANVCSKVQTHRSHLQPSSSNNSAQPPTHPQNNPAHHLPTLTPSTPPPLTPHPSHTKTHPTSPPHQQQQISSAQALTCNPHPCHPYPQATLL